MVSCENGLDTVKRDGNYNLGIYRNEFTFKLHLIEIEKSPLDQLRQGHPGSTLRNPSKFPPAEDAIPSAGAQKEFSVATLCRLIWSIPQCLQSLPGAQREMLKVELILSIEPGTANQRSQTKMVHLVYIVILVLQQSEDGWTKL